MNLQHQYDTALKAASQYFPEFTVKDENLSGGFSFSRSIPEFYSFRLSYASPNKWILRYKDVQLCTRIMSRIGDAEDICRDLRQEYQRDALKVASYTEITFKEDGHV